MLSSLKLLTEEYGTKSMSEEALKSLSAYLKDLAVKITVKAKAIAGKRRKIYKSDIITAYNEFRQTEGIWC